MSTPEEKFPMLTLIQEWRQQRKQLMRANGGSPVDRRAVQMSLSAIVEKISGVFEDRTGRRSGVFRCASSVYRVGFNNESKHFFLTDETSMPIFDDWSPISMPEDPQIQTKSEGYKAADEAPATT